MAAGLTVLLFSIAGIPPFAGFFAKFFAFLPAVEAGLLWLVIVAVLASVVSAVYYLRLIKLMWFDDTKDPMLAAPGGLVSLVGGGAFLVTVLPLLPFVAEPGRILIQNAAKALF